MRLSSVWIFIAITCISPSYCKCGISKGVEIQVSQERLRKGDAYNITCSIVDLEEVQRNCKSSQIDMLANNTKVATKYINATTLYHQVDSAQPQHISSGYFCSCNGAGLVAIKFQIGVQLHIDDFDCHFLDEPGTQLVCTFSAPPQSFVVNPQTSYKLEYKRRWWNCTTTTNSFARVQCIVPSSHFSKFESEYKLTVSMDDGLGVMNNTFTRSKTECTVLPAMEELRQLNRSSNSHCLQYTDLRKSNHDGACCEYNLKLEPNTTHKVSTDNSNLIICLSQLLPHQNYTLNVSRRLNHPKTHWSEEAVYKFSTDATIPPRPPNVWSNGYVVDSSRRELLVYWQPLNESEYNGFNFTYNVTVRDSLGNFQVGNANIHLESNTARISGMPPSTSGSDTYVITIKSQNSAGLSENSSDILISQLTNAEDRKPIDMCIETETQKLRWKEPKITDGLTSYTIYSCDTTKAVPDRCKDPLRLAATNTNSWDNYFIFHNSYKYYKWAVAGNYSGSTAAGGIVWLDDKNSCHTNAGEWWFDNRNVHAIIALGVLGVTLYFLIRKFRYMSDIKVDLPPGVLVDRESNQLLLTATDDIPLTRRQDVYSVTIKPIVIDNKSDITDKNTSTDNSAYIDTSATTDNSAYIDTSSTIDKNTFSIDNVNNAGYTELSPMLSTPRFSATDNKSISPRNEPAVMDYVAMDMVARRQLPEYVKPPGLYTVL
ncbi:cytokine receptor isoform X1 [Drosophila nasuta]|uniref:cytokine receptor isoform X1 n=1 Tax=Drosophila nasuta TaxID=42062 RepID=UPI00295E7292|nr:cytokine receptor isoform X1 [Drosophila nasuta]